MVLKGFPNGSHIIIGSTVLYCNIGEKPTVTLYTSYINHQVGTPKQKQTTGYYTLFLD